MDPLVIELSKIGPILGAAPLAPIIVASIIGGAASILSRIFGGGKKSSSSNKTATTTQTTTSTPTGYQSPTLGLWDTAIGNLLGQNVIRSSGAGYPGGKGLDTGLASQVVSLLGGEGQKLLDMYKRGGSGMNPSGSGFAPRFRLPTQMGRTDVTSCKDNCWNTFKNDPNATSADYEACVAKCGGQGV